MPKKRGEQEPDAQPEPGKATGKEAARRLRAALTEQPLTIAQMVEVLGTDEATVLVALRRLRKAGRAKAKTGKGHGGRSRGARRPSRLRSGMVAGRPCWWWKPDEREATEPQPGREDE
jgi:hypothetical protein